MKQIVENDKLLRTVIIIGIVSVIFLVPGVSLWTEGELKLGIMLTAPGIVAFVLFVYYAVKWDKWESEKLEKAAEEEKKAKEEKKKAEEEERRRRELEKTRCPKCGQLNAIQVHKKLIDERLIGVRYEPHYKCDWEVEDYEQRYLISEECRFCDYCDSYENSERKTVFVRELH